jgi:hypothetical protein
VAYFVLAFGFAWLFYLVPLALHSHGLLPFRLPTLVEILLGSYGPTYAALIVTWALSGMPGIRRLLSGLLIWRVGIQWYLVAVFMLLSSLIGPGVRLVGWHVPMPQPSLDLAQVLLSSSSGPVNGKRLAGVACAPANASAPQRRPPTWCWVSSGTRSTPPVP